MASIIKDYRGNVIFHVPSVNIDLGNLKSIDSKVKKLVKEELKEHGINHVTLELEEVDEKCDEECCKINTNKEIGHHHHHH